MVRARGLARQRRGNGEPLDVIETDALGLRNVLAHGFAAGAAAASRVPELRDLIDRLLAE